MLEIMLKSANCVGVVRDPPRHAREPEEVLGEERDVREDRGEPEVQLAELLVVLWPVYLRQPVVGAGERAEQRARHEHVMEVRDDEIRVVILDVGRDDREHEAREAAEREQEQERERSRASASRT